MSEKTLLAPAKNKGIRQANIELLRVLSMLMIITLHFFGHGGVLSNVEYGSLQYYFSWFLEGIAYVAVNCYVLIGGYFGIKSKFNFKKLFILLCEVFFFSVAIYLIFVSTNKIDFSLNHFIQALFPTTLNRYWFITVYVSMYILSPFLNTAVNAMSKAQLKYCIMTVVFLFSIYPLIFSFASFLNIGIGSGLVFGGGNGVVWFIVLYITAAYLRLHYSPTYNAKKSLIVYSLIAVIVPTSYFVINWLLKCYFPNSSSSLENVAKVFYTYNSLPVYFASVALFVLFLNIKLNNRSISKAISFFSANTLGVYLIHDNLYVRTFLWDKV
ncbi:MAG TPA: acyltransferase family protein, partial [Clostridia bacterium]|nr:acyltransferase family protein [Clostridia bacterium]